MIRREVFRSESGLRPMSAFVVVAVVLLGVGARVAGVALAAGQPNVRVTTDSGLEPAFELVDTRGRRVAHFVDRLDLVLSPRSMWLAHTPAHMAARIAEVVEADDPEALLSCMLPDAREGWIEVEGLTLSPRQASDVLEWASRGAVAPGEDPGPPLAGLRVVPGPEAGAGRPPRYRLCWAPAVLLSRSEREAHGVRSPTRWTRRLLDGLSRTLAPPTHGADLFVPEDCRRQLWERLMPTGHCVALEGVPAERALALEGLLANEGVSPLQMRLTRGRDRRYPAGELEILGSWGRVTGDEPEPMPRAGLELVAERVFAREDWPLASSAPSAYAYRVHRNRALGRTQYFLDWHDRQDPPRVVTTLDTDLLRATRRELTQIMAEHRPAVAMALVLDLASGDVLAVDSLESEPVQPFAPVYYAFTPGSTFKMVTMATALESGRVRPDEVFDVGQGSFRLPGSWRTIREAEGSKTGEITATQSFAFSVNAGLVQIGQRVPDAEFREKMLRLGYATYPGAGLGPEQPGYVPALPWKANWAHASISFGHELLTTLWQHGAALAAIARGGEWRPLRLVAAVEQGGRRVELESPEARPVFRADTCRQIRAMMAVGAHEGTGRKIARPDIVMGTKTGTAEKVSTEVCAHVAAEARAAFAERGEPFTAQDFAALRGRAKPHSRCYTSSMCAVGRRADDPQGREVMVLVVVDEPRGKAKYGSDVAGPAAANLLAQALGCQREAGSPVPVTADGFALSASELSNPEDQPWRLR